jgi:hypothetical protein
MSSSTNTAAPEEPVEPEQSGSRGWRRLVPMAVMLMIVGAIAVLPMIRNHIFYFWDDSAAAAVPVWRRMAEVVLAGNFPLLELDMWRGGNFAAEAAIGMWNPVALGLAIVTYPIDNMALAITIVKFAFMGILAVGTYLLAREYGVRPWLAAAAGAVVPLTGYTFFMDATVWINGLMITAFVPWVWLTARRTIRGEGSVVWVIVTGYLCCSLGPYALLATGMVLFGVMIEAWVNGRRSRVWPILLAGVAIGLLNAMIYLPLLGTQGVGYRAGSDTFNNEFLAPSLTDLFAMSTPTFQPYVLAFGLDYFTLPAAYLAWFVMPLVPWLRWRAVRTEWRSLVTVFFVGAVFLLLVLGPSNVWLFRWPMRLVVYLWFPVILLWVFVANKGLETSRARVRAVISAGIIVFGGYLAWADQPGNIKRITAGAVLVAVLVGLVVWRGINTRGGIAVLLAGTFAVSAYHVYLYPGNYQTEPYYMPTSQKYLTEQFAKYQGVTVQVASGHVLRQQSASTPDRGYKDMLLGGMYSAAGVESLTGYGGLGYTAMDNTFCMIYEGSTTCPRAWSVLWSQPSGYTVPLADLLRAQTIVVQNKLVDTRGLTSDPPRGWQRDPSSEETGMFTVWKRTDPLPFPDGRVSNASEGVVIDSDAMDGRVDERITYHRADASAPGRLTFARLAWPGYSATVNGTEVEVRSGPSGLLTVDLPAGVTAGEVRLSWEPPPGMTVLAGSFVAGMLLTLGLAFWPVLARRRARRDTGEEGGTGGDRPAGPPRPADQQSEPVPAVTSTSSASSASSSS